MKEIAIAKHFNCKENIVLFEGDCRELLSEIPDNTIQLVITSPPYNIGKAYEKKVNLDVYLEQQRVVIKECYRILKDQGHICWQVGNYIEDGEIMPLDILLYPIFKELGFKMRNRIIWHFEHGLHCTKRFSGRYETINWFTKTDNYKFGLDLIRIPQKYPGKRYFKGPKKGQYSCNPLGKNPGDLWEIPNVKFNHPEKTIHPCQFPVELVERLVLSMTDENDWVLDPFMGVATTAVTAIIHGRRAVGAEIEKEYLNIGKQRVLLAFQGRLNIRPMYRPIYDPNLPSGGQKRFLIVDSPVQMKLFESKVSSKQD